MMQPPMSDVRSSDQWRGQYHLRFTTASFARKRNLGVVLAPKSAGITSPEVSTERIGDTEVARTGNAFAAVNQGSGIDAERPQSDALIAVRAGGGVYEVSDSGIKGA